MNTSSLNIASQLTRTSRFLKKTDSEKSPPETVQSSPHLLMIVSKYAWRLLLLLSITGFEARRLKLGASVTNTECQKREQHTSGIAITMVEKATW